MPAMLKSERPGAAAPGGASGAGAAAALPATWRTVRLSPFWMPREATVAVLGSVGRTSGCGGKPAKTSKEPTGTPVFAANASRKSETRPSGSIPERRGQQTES